MSVNAWKTLSEIVGFVLAFVLGVSAADPAATRTQTVDLKAGWNAVFLEVEPANPEPAAVFAGTPVDMAASFFARAGSAQYITDPAANLYKRAGWGVWYAPERPDAFLSTLHAVHGQRGYLVHALADLVWPVQGQVVRLPYRWEPNAFNLTGFPVARQGAPTFAQYFQGSKAHRHNRIYRLEGGSWRRVLDPSAEAMRSGEAFWIFCDGASTYQGPLRVQTPIERALFLGRAVGDVVLRNESTHPLTPTMEHVAAEGDPVPLSIVLQGVRGGGALRSELAAPKPAGAWVQTLPPIEAGEGIRVPLEARREALTGAHQVSLLKISTDLGTEEWVPVISGREDLEEQ